MVFHPSRALKITAMFTPLDANIWHDMITRQAGKSDIRRGETNIAHYIS